MNFVPTNYVIPYSDDIHSDIYNEQSVLGVISKTPELSEFYKVVKFTKMEETLDLSNRITIFAPANDVFTKKINIDLSDFLNAKNVIMSSMIRGIYTQDDLIKNITYKDYDIYTGKHKLKIFPRTYHSYRPYNKIIINMSSGSLNVNGKVNIVKDSIHTDNGIIHITDGILVPEILI